MKNLFIALYFGICNEPLFSNGVILFELDSLVNKIRFYRLPKTLVISYITDIYIAEMLRFKRTGSQVFFEEFDHIVRVALFFSGYGT